MLLYIRVYLYFIQHNIYWLIVHKIITVYIANTEGTPGIEIEPNFSAAGYSFFAYETIPHFLAKQQQQQQQGR